MLNDQQATTVKKVCCDVFEQLAFMFAEDISFDDIEYRDDERFIHATMSFSGQGTGGIELALPSNLAPVLAKNILGLDDEEPLDPQHYDDAVKELLNTICGRMLTSLFGEDAVFDLHVPTTTYLTVPQLRALIEKGDCIAVAVNEVPVIIHPIL